MTTTRPLITTAKKKHRNIYQFDVNNVFLHIDLHEKVYMKVPPGLIVPNTGVVFKFKKSLYSLKQASRQWYENLTATSSQFKRLHAFTV